METYLLVIFIAAAMAVGWVGGYCWRSLKVNELEDDLNILDKMAQILELEKRLQTFLFDWPSRKEVK